MNTEGNVHKASEGDLISSNLESRKLTNDLRSVESKHLSVPYNSSTFQTLAHKFAQEKNYKARRRLLAMYASHLLNFKRSILLSRRRWQQRLQRRQTLLRSFFMQQLMELETNFLELLPMPKSGPFNEINNDEQLLTSSSEEITSVSPHSFCEDILGLKSHEQWLSFFRMSKSSFEWLCDQLKEIIQNSRIRKLINRDEQIALALHGFATGLDYARIMNIFEIADRVSFFNIVKRLAEAILKKLGKQFLTMPNSNEEYERIGNAFQQASNMPSAVVGVLGVCELSAKPVTKQIYSNSVGNNRFIMQMLIDDKLCFRKVKLDSRHPTLLLEEKNEITNLEPKLINERPVQRFIVTPDTYYPLRTWLMHKYQEPEEPHEYDFNEAVDNLFVFKDRALKRLFARWHILQYLRRFDPLTMEKIALACCVLHNIVEKHDEPFNEEWTPSHMTSFTMSTRFKPVLNTLRGGTSSWQTADASEVRNFIGRTISSTEM